MSNSIRIRALRLAAALLLAMALCDRRLPATVSAAGAAGGGGSWSNKGRCPALKLRLRMPKTTTVDKPMRMRISLRNTCKNAGTVPNVLLALDLPHGVEVVGTGPGGGSKASKSGGGKNHTRELQARRDDGSGPYTLRGHKAIRRDLRVGIRPCTDAARAQKLHFVVQALLPDVPGWQPVKASAQVIVKPSSAQNRTCPPVLLPNVTVCDDPIVVPAGPGGSEATYYGCSYGTVYDGHVGQMPCGVIHLPGILLKNAKECLYFCNNMYQAPAVAIDELAPEPISCFCMVYEANVTRPESTRLYIRGASTTLPVIETCPVP